MPPTIPDSSSSNTDRPAPSAELSNMIQNRIAELNPKGLGDGPIETCKERLNALPLHANLVYLWAIRPDGILLCLDHGAFNYPTEPETDPLIIYAALLHGAAIYPELHTLIPPRPPLARLCGECLGTGMQDTATFCLGCRGLGWV
jgi:hypothetical protein